MSVVSIFTGYDEREAVGWHVFVSSLLKRASVPVAIHPIQSQRLHSGSNHFTFSRFLVPWMMGFTGHALFFDACDMLCLGNVAELEALFNPAKAIQVVKHPDYESLHARKYIGTEMECKQTNYSRKNWASCAIINCAHKAWAGMTPEEIWLMPPLHLLQLSFIADCDIGGLPADWNCLIDENQDDTHAKLIHWSSGIPGFKHYQNARRSLDWFEAYEAMTARPHERRTM